MKQRPLREVGASAWQDRVQPLIVWRKCWPQFRRQRGRKRRAEDSKTVQDCGVKISQAFTDHSRIGPRQRYDYTT
jgi:hypothetical protein